jgi:hypothetical protein
MNILQSRRQFAATISLAGVAGLIGSRAALADDRAVRFYDLGTP